MLFEGSSENSQNHKPTRAQRKLMVFAENLELTQKINQILHHETQHIKDSFTKTILDTIKKVNTSDHEDITLQENGISANKCILPELELALALNNKWIHPSVAELIQTKYYESIERITSFYINTQLKLKDLQETPTPKGPLRTKRLMKEITQHIQVKKEVLYIYDLEKAIADTHRKQIVDLLNIAFTKKGFDFLEQNRLEKTITANHSSFQYIEQHNVPEYKNPSFENQALLNIPAEDDEGYLLRFYKKIYKKVMSTIDHFDEAISSYISTHPKMSTESKTKLRGFVQELQDYEEKTYKHDQEIAEHYWHHSKVKKTYKEISDTSLIGEHELKVSFSFLKLSIKKWAETIKKIYQFLKLIFKIVPEDLRNELA